MSKTIDVPHNEICSLPKPVKASSANRQIKIGVSAALLLALAAFVQVAVSNGKSATLADSNKPSFSPAINKHLECDTATSVIDPNIAMTMEQLGDQAAYKGDFHGAVIEYRRSLAQKDNSIVRKKLALMLVGCAKHNLPM